MEPPPPQAMDQEHLKLLSIFHYILAALAALTACIPVLHLIFGLVMVIHPEKFGQGNQAPPPFVGWLFIILGSVFISIGWAFAALVLIAGRFISRQKHHTFCFVMACVECLFMPFGTVLGVFTLLVLMRPSVKGMFNPMSRL